MKDKKNIILKYLLIVLIIIFILILTIVIISKNKINNTQKNEFSEFLNKNHFKLVKRMEAGDKFSNGTIVENKFESYKDNNDILIIIYYIDDFNRNKEILEEDFIGCKDKSITTNNIKEDSYAYASCFDSEEERYDMFFANNKYYIDMTGYYHNDILDDNYKGKIEQILKKHL